jgi:hypothetical protein
MAITLRRFMAGADGRIPSLRSAITADRCASLTSRATCQDRPRFKFHIQNSDRPYLTTVRDQSEAGANLGGRAARAGVNSQADQAVHLALPTANHRSSGRRRDGAEPVGDAGGVETANRCDRPAVRSNVSLTSPPTRRCALVDRIPNRVVEHGALFRRPCTSLGRAKLGTCRASPNRPPRLTGPPRPPRPPPAPRMSRREAAQLV